MSTPAPPLPACPVEVTLTMLSERWKVLILRDLLTGTKRFGELKKSVSGISQKVLTSNLRSMEQCGLLRYSGCHGGGKDGACHACSRASSGQAL